MRVVIVPGEMGEGQVPKGAVVLMSCSCPLGWCVASGREEAA